MTLGAGLRTALRIKTPRAFRRQLLARRQLSSVPPAHRSRTWKGSVARWGLAGAGIWYYNTHDVWADTGFSDQTYLITPNDDTTDLPTIESITASRRQHFATVPALDAPSPSVSARDSSAASAVALSSAYPPSSSSTTTPSSSSSSTPDQSPTPASDAPTTASPGTAELEEDAESQGAFNPETGEINWDCPCLGGMAHGPCGAEFRDAFSCFVYSNEDPKGINCIDRFKTMQDCFRAHPDVYGDELVDGGEEDGEGAMADEGALGAAGEARQSFAQPGEEAKAATAPYSGSAGPAASSPGANLTSTPSAGPSSLSGNTGISEEASSKDDNAKLQAQAQAQTQERSRAAAAQVRETSVGRDSEGETQLVPKAWHDARDKN